MKYRRFGTLDWEVSVLGFGVMRLPSIDEDPAKTNEAESTKMIRYAIDHGVNYLDLGYPYDMRQHERLTRLVSQALQDGYRKKIKIATMLPSFFVDSSPNFERLLDEQLRWLQTDRIDFCLLGRLNRENWPRMQGLGVLRWAERAMTDGRIDKLGFSFHDHFQVLRSILDAYDNWALCQFQYSYMDVDHDPGVSGLKYAAEKGLAVVIAEPLRWGRLTKEPLESVARVWAGSRQERTLAEWGLRWVWDHPEVSVVVSDMSTMEQVVENVALADSAEPDRLTVQELVLVSQVREAYHKLRPIPCPSCRACMPCPEGIDVPRIFELYNDAVMYNDVKTARSLYCGEQHCADSCTECGACVNACAKRIAVLDWLKRAHRLLAGRG
ncbi:MAG: aldo/keto reductase [Thermodesulfobacteriota bacterium]|jgi:predicted aldo/keto reductase-like oxidoreductase